MDRPVPWRRCRRARDPAHCRGWPAPRGLARDLLRRSARADIVRATGETPVTPRMLFPFASLALCLASISGCAATADEADLDQDAEQQLGATAALGACAS